VKSHTPYMRYRASPNPQFVTSTEVPNSCSQDTKIIGVYHREMQEYIVINRSRRAKDGNKKNYKMRYKVLR
jgi:hypothetical protein